jgi:hypothetical protein
VECPVPVLHTQEVGTFSRALRLSDRCYELLELGPDNGMVGGAFHESTAHGREDECKNLGSSSLTGLFMFLSQVAAASHHS